MIQLDNTSVGISYEGSTFYVDALYENTTYGGLEAPDCPDWITFDYVGGAQYTEGYRETYEFTVEPNSGTARTGRIIFECQDTSGNTWVNYTYVHQGCGTFTVAPIWKDTFYYASGYSSFNYSIKTDGVSIYYGKAYCAPGEGGPLIQVNKICQNYLKNVLPDFRGVDDQVFSNNDAVKAFSLCNNDGVEVMNYRFLIDYAGAWSGETGYVMTEPINGHLDPRMYVMHTQYNNVQTNVNYEIND